MSNHRFQLVSAFTAVYVIWGSTYLAIRFAIETIPPFLMAGTRFVIAGGVMYVVARIAGAPRPSWLHWRSALVVGALLLLGGNGGVVWAEQHVASGVTAMLVASEPLWVVLIDWARPGGKRPTHGEAIGLITGFVGVVWLVNPVSAVGRGAGGELIGSLVVVIAALSWALGSVVSRNASHVQSPFLDTAMKMFAGGCCLVLAGTLRGDWGVFELAAVSTRSLWAYLYLIGAGSLIGFTSYIWLLRHTSLAKASTYAYVNPVVAIVLGWVLAGEPLTGRVVSASGVIVLGVVITTLAKTRRSTVPAAEVA